MRHASYAVGDRDTRPWGVWEVLAVGLTYCVKRITVRAQRRLSLQRHQHRDEHWAVVTGHGTVTLGTEEFEAFPGALFTVPHGLAHRITAGDETLVLIEVQTGDCLEEDIERLEDDYGRT